MGFQQVRQEKAHMLLVTAAWAHYFDFWIRWHCLNRLLSHLWPFQTTYLDEKRAFRSCLAFFTYVWRWAQSPAKAHCCLGSPGIYCQRCKGKTQSGGSSPTQIFTSGSPVQWSHYLPDALCIKNSWTIRKLLAPMNEHVGIFLMRLKKWLLICTIPISFVSNEFLLVNSSWSVFEDYSASISAFCGTICGKDRTFAGESLLYFPH